MKIRNWLLLFLIGFSLIVTLSAIIFTINEERQTLESQIDRELLSVALMADDVLPAGYHERITGPESVSDAEYQQIVETFNQICVEANLEYIWSLMILDDRIVFTSATSPGKDASQRDHAGFLEEHSNPELYTRAFETMQPQFQTSSDKWGTIRAVLVPHRDASGRPYLMGASRSMQVIEDQMQKTLLVTSLFGVGFFLLGIILSISMANRISHLIGQVIDGTQRISAGDYSRPLAITGPTEMATLATSINAMQESLRERKQIEEILRISQERLEAGLSAANSGLWDWNIVTNKVFFDARYFTIAGYEPDEFPHEFDQWSRRVHPDDLTYCQSAVQTYLSGNSPVLNIEFRFLRKDGDWLWIRGFGKAVEWDKDGTIIRMVGVHTDITQRKHLEINLRESEERYRLLFEEMAEGFALHEIILDEAGKPADYRFLDVNPAYERLTGLKREDLVGHTVLEVLPETEPFWIQSFGEVALTGVDAQMEDFARQLGKWYDVRVFCPKPGQFAVTFSDITRRKLAEEELRNTAKFPNQNPNPVLRISIDGKVLFANATSQVLLDYWETRLDEVLPAAWQARVLSIYENNTNQEIKIEINHQVYSCIFVPIAGDGYVNIYARDITARVIAEREISALNKELEQRVRERTMQLEASNKELEAFSYSVSHDLRSPLRGIDGWSQALLEDFSSQLAPTARQYLDRVRNEAQRMTRLIDDLLKLSRLTRADMKMTSVDLSALAQNIAGDLREKHADQNMQFEIQPGLTCRGDQRLLEIALTNLLANARKFSSKEPVSRIAFGSTEVEGKPVFFVRDNGVGFDMAYTQNLFGEFQRLHSQAEFPGTGIGLATVRRIIHRHGGIIWADARPDEGATFYFALPINGRVVQDD